MAANVPNPGLYLSGLGQLFTTTRDNFNKIVQANNYIEAMGGETFLTTAAPNGLGMESTDAAALIAALGNWTQLSAVANGAATQTSELNFISNSSPFWGGN